MNYLLDTNILSDVIKNPQGIIAKRMIACSELVMTSIIVASEMRFGAEKKGSATLTERVELLLENITVVPFDIDADRYYGQIRKQLEIKGQLIGANDLLIAAHAFALQAVLVTANVKEFSRIESLMLENWFV